MRFDVEVHYLTDGVENFRVFEAIHSDPVKDLVFNTLKWTGPNKESYEFKSDIYLRHWVKNRSVSDIEPKYEVNRQIGLLDHSLVHYTTHEGKSSSYIDGDINRNAYILHVEIANNEFGVAEPFYTISIIVDGDSLNKVINSPNKKRVFERCLVDEVFDDQGNVDKKKNSEEE